MIATGQESGSAKAELSQIRTEANGFRHFSIKYTEPDETARNGRGIPVLEEIRGERRQEIHGFPIHAPLLTQSGDAQNLEVASFAFEVSWTADHFGPTGAEITNCHRFLRANGRPTWARLAELIHGVLFNAQFHQLVMIVARHALRKKWNSEFRIQIALRPSPIVMDLHCIACNCEMRNAKLLRL
jgi:hypothetical protein